MKKEILFAVGIGLVVGLIITFGMYRARQAVTGATTVNNQLNGTLSSPPLTTEGSQSARDAFLVSEPQDEALITDPNIRVSGQAFPSAAIVILVGDNETVGTADDKGNFSVPITLSSGGNVIYIRALSDTTDPLEVIRNVVVSTADLNQNATMSATPKPTVTPKPSITPKTKASPTPTAKPRATPGVPQ